MLYRVLIPVSEVDGGWSDWTSFSKCSATCGGGISTRSRSCTHPAPAYGGRSCSGDSHSSGHCNTQSCPSNSLNYLYNTRWYLWTPRKLQIATVTSVLVIVYSIMFMLSCFLKTFLLIFLNFRNRSCWK